MQVREYLSVRRAYNLVRQSMPVNERLTFEEFCILCHLHYASSPMKTSDIAEYQHVLRPTMTHRTNHLSDLGLIERFSGATDKRTVCCTLTERGRQTISAIAEACTEQITTGMALNRAEPERMLKYANAMGTIYCTSGDLVLLCLGVSESMPLKVGILVDRLGLLQPTASMAVRELSKEGLLVRDSRNPNSMRSGDIVLTKVGKDIADRLIDQIEGMVVRRKARK